MPGRCPAEPVSTSMKSRGAPETVQAARRGGELGKGGRQVARWNSPSCRSKPQGKSGDVIRKKTTYNPGKENRPWEVPARHRREAAEEKKPLRPLRRPRGTKGIRRNQGFFPRGDRITRKCENSQKDTHFNASKSGAAFRIGFNCDLSHGP